MLALVGCGACGFTGPVAARLLAALTLWYKVYVRLTRWFWILPLCCLVFPVAFPLVWILAAVFKAMGYRFHLAVLAVSAGLTIAAIALFTPVALEPLQIDGSPSCSTQRDAWTMRSIVRPSRGPGGQIAVVRSEVCAYPLAQGGVVHFVFVTGRNERPDRRNLVLRYTSTKEDYSLADPPAVRWANHTLEVTVPRGTMYALTHRRDRIGNTAIAFHMQPQEDDSSLQSQILDSVFSANLLNALFYYAL
ncbi:MAG TPA: hypothetical protein VFL13_04415 [Candidatus Baltobacteraceae bacterium]|nr:hypothetical protein [Candidatus Baltobacteraceae bacterium]